MREERRIVESIYERWNRNEGDLALDLFDEEVRITQIAQLFDSEGSFHGHEGLVRSATELNAAFDRIEWRAKEWAEEGQWLIVPIDVIGVGAASGIEMSVDVVHLWRVRDGLVTDFSVFETPEAARQAAHLRGLPEAEGGG